MGKFFREREAIVTHLAETLPKLRKKYGISQSELGEKVGVSRQTISAIERGIAPLTWTTALAILMFFTANSNNVFCFPKRIDFVDAKQIQHALAIKKGCIEKEEIL